MLLCYVLFVTELTVLYTFFGVESKNQDLKYWEPDPEFTRRSFDNAKHKKYGDKDNKLFRYNRGKVTQKSGNPAPMLAENFGQERMDRARHARDRKKWPKVHNKRPLRQRDDDAEIRSTRMTPMYLMQQTDEQAETTKKPENGEEISPYAIKKQMETLASKFPEANITIEVLARTAAYNDIVLLKITEVKSEAAKYFRTDDTKYMDEVPEKKIVFIVHGLTVMGMRFIDCFIEMNSFQKLVSYYLAHLDKFDIFFIPLANPDGLHSFDKLSNTYWNKNESPQTACPGVALDRNFDVAWNNSKVMSSCSQRYPGPAPFSEPETRAIRDVLHRYSHKIIAYLHVHSGTFSYDVFKGDAILYPKGYSDVQADDDKYIDLKGEVDEAMKNASFQAISVTVDTLHNWYGKVYGSSVDYASTVYGIPYAMELVMQIYNQHKTIFGTYDTTMGDLALTEIWKRMIDVIFNNIWKNSHSNDVK